MTSVTRGHVSKNEDWTHSYEQLFAGSWTAIWLLLAIAGFGAGMDAFAVETQGQWFRVTGDLFELFWWNLLSAWAFALALAGAQTWPGRRGDGA